MIAKVLDFIVNNKFGCYVYDSDKNIVACGQLYKHMDANNIPVYSINHDQWLLRESEIVMIDFEKNNDAGLYLAI